MNKFCENCGNKLNEGARFCAKCGAPTNAAPMQNEYAAPPQGYNTPAYQNHAPQRAIATRTDNDG